MTASLLPPRRAPPKPTSSHGQEMNTAWRLCGCQTTVCSVGLSGLALPFVQVQNIHPSFSGFSNKSLGFDFVTSLISRPTSIPPRTDLGWLREFQGAVTYQMPAASTRPSESRPGARRGRAANGMRKPWRPELLYSYPCAAIAREICWSKLSPPRLPPTLPLPVLERYGRAAFALPSDFRRSMAMVLRRHNSHSRGSRRASGANRLSHPSAVGIEGHAI